MASVKIASLHKAYGNTEVLRNISLTVADGEFMTLVGPSGCGKSTLLRMIAGLETITGGDITIGDKLVNDVQPTDRDVAMVFQNYALYPNKTVAANIGFPLKMDGESKAAIDAKVREVAHTLGLESLLDRYPKQLSGGQRQRVAMGRAIVRKPKVFLFDEPLSNLDAKLRVKMRAEIKELHQRLRTTMIYVTHDQVEAMTMADKIVVLRDGNLEQVGAPLDLYDRPANTFVASFIGSPAMNFLEGAVVSEGGGVQFRSKGGLLVALDARRAHLAGRAMTLGIRPEHLVLDTTAAPGALQMTVSVVEPTGSEATFMLRAGAEELVATKSGRHDVRPGATVWITPMTAQVHLFDEKLNAV
jgi:multiple sugar transport system ATP-binding protein